MTIRGEGSVVITCANCGKEKSVFVSRVKYGDEGKYGYGKNKFCSRSCANSYNNRGKKNPMYGRRGEDSPTFGKRASNWKGGRKKERGYVLLYRPEHPHAVRGYVREHRLVMEKKLGRYLEKSELVHHLDHIKDDNREENLMLMGSKSVHGKLHGRPRGIPMHPNTRKSLEKLGRTFK